MRTRDSAPNYPAIRAELRDEGAARTAEGDITITLIGHAAFQVVSPGGTTLVLDPFIVKNPTTREGMKDLAAYKPDAILVSHSHFDHVAEAGADATGANAKLIGPANHVRSLELAEDLAPRGSPQLGQS